MYLYQLFEGDTLRYVGYTSDIHYRMNEYLKTEGRMDYKAGGNAISRITKIMYAEMSNADAYVYKAYLIAKYNPTWNKDHTEGYLNLHLTNSGIFWREYPLTLDDNPKVAIRVWKENLLMYEIPMLHCVYDELCKAIGIDQDMNFEYNNPVYVNGFRLVKVPLKRNGKNKSRPKYIFMGYPRV